MKSGAKKGSIPWNKGKGVGWIYNGYRKIKINGKDIKEHHVIWIKHFGAIPKNCVIHHKDFDRQNNSIENLELMTRGNHVRFHNILNRDELKIRASKRQRNSKGRFTSITTAEKLEPWLVKVSNALVTVLVIKHETFFRKQAFLHSPLS